MNRTARIRIAIVSSLVAVVAGMSAPAAQASHSVLATLTPSAGVWGTTFDIRASTTSSTLVKLQRRFVGSTSWTDVSGQSKTSDGSGNANFGDAPSVHTDYRVVVVSDGAASNIVRALVRVGIPFYVTRSGQQALFQGRVLPGHPGKRVMLQMFDGPNQRWNTVKTGLLNSRSAYNISFKATDDGRRLFRVAWATQDNNHLWNLSQQIFVTWVPA